MSPTWETGCGPAGPCCLKLTGNPEICWSKRGSGCLTLSNISQLEYEYVYILYMYTYGVHIYIYTYDICMCMLCMYIYIGRYTHQHLCTTFKPTFRLSKWDPIHGQRVCLGRHCLKMSENLGENHGKPQNPMNIQWFC